MVGIFRATLSAGVLVAFSAASAAHAQPAVSFEGKPVTVYIGVGPGGGFDLYARTLARHMGRHLPGKPTIVPKNVPGAGSVQLANQIPELPRDGTAIAALDNALYMHQLLGSIPNVKFDAAQFNWLGRLAGLPLLLISWHTSPVKTADETLTTEMTVGIPGAGAYSGLLLGAVKGVLGAKFKFISGYQSGADVRLALERGEIDGTASIQWTLMREQQRDWIADRKVNLLIQLGLTSYPDLKDVPLVRDLAKTEEQKQILTVFLAPAEIGRAYVAPPGMAQDRVDLLRTAFAAMTRDEAFIADAAKQNLEIDPMDGVTLQALVKSIGGIPPATLARAREVMEQAERK
ncbi:MAG: Bug family tripartite tricarboxylate transporter substrate binding protein [Gemmatimonas sp.]